MEACEAPGPLSPQDEVCMHLTNYAINKHNENFVRDDTVGSKRYSLLLSPLPLPLSPKSPQPMKLGLAFGQPIAQKTSTFTDPCPVPDHQMLPQPHPDK